MALDSTIHTKIGQGTNFERKTAASNRARTLRKNATIYEKDTLSLPEN